MLRTVRCWIVDGLEALDSLLDRIPAVYRHEGNWHLSPYGDWGCRLGLALKSSQLDERWGTECWSAPRSSSELDFNDD